MAFSRHSFLKLVQNIKAKKILRLDQAMKQILDGTLSGHVIALTFDDGYKDNYSIARDILFEHGIPATFFFFFFHLKQNIDYWWDTLHNHVRRYKVDFHNWVSMQKEFADRPSILAEVPEDDSSWDVWARYLVRWLNDLGYEFRIHFLDRMVAEFGVKNGQCLMTWDEVRQLHKLGFEVGSHALSHEPLTQLGQDRVKAEVEQSKEALEEVLGAAVPGFSYPRGAWDERCATTVKNAGYDYAVSTMYGSNDDPVNVFALQRRGVADYQGFRSFFPITVIRIELTGILDNMLKKRR